MRLLDYDLVVVGGGCAGMAAAVAARKEGVQTVLILERSAYMGGVLRQCIHNGFGLHRFNEDLTGTEYAARLLKLTQAEQIDILTETIVLNMEADRTVIAMNTNGLMTIQAKAIIIATGCRERPRGTLCIPGTRPAGVMTAGTAQRYLNLEGYLVGKKIVILGSGDIGLIMARQFILEGAEVLAVAELQPYSSGLTRNIVQCIEDFQIPLYFNTTVCRIEGTDRVTGVWLAQVDEHKNPIPETQRLIECDSLILSVGLIPENELAHQIHMTIDSTTGGPMVDDTYQTSIPGIFVCGNALHVHDLADFVTVESELAGKNAAIYIQRSLAAAKMPVTGLIPSLVKVMGGRSIRGIVPQYLHRTGDGVVKLQFRPAQKYQNHFITVYSGDEPIYQKKCMILTPGEMCEITIERAKIKNDLTVEVEE